MPIERFQTYTDTTPAGKVNFHDYIFDVTPEVKADEKNWVPYIDGVHFIPLWFGTRSQPGFSNILRVQPGKQLNPTSIGQRSALLSQVPGTIWSMLGRKRDVPLGAA
jgi:hypothetical protein